MAPFPGLLAVLALLFAATASSTASAERRVALVIGNDAYQNLPVLRKAVADARAYAALLKEQGFDEVTLHTDLTRAATDEAVAAFLDGIAPGDTAVFSFAGHGWSDGSQNYLVAIDAPTGGRQEFLARVSIPLKNGATGVLDDMERRGAGLKVAIIDACRDNPFTAAGGTRAAGLSRGLSRVEPPSGTFVVFSAGTGQSALDRLSNADVDPNSVFTRVFLPLMRAGLTLQEATKQAQQRVAELARTVSHDQRPAYYDEVIGKACLAGSCDSSSPPPPAAAATPGTDAAAAYQAALAVNSVEGWDAFLKYHPEGFYADLARSARKKLDAVVAALPNKPAPPKSAGPASKRTVEITQCDRMAAISLDADKPVKLRGLDREPKEPAKAIAACRDAVKKHPNVARYKTQLAYTLWATEEFAESRRLFEEAAKAGHAAAEFGLGLMYARGVGVPADPVAAGRHLTRSSDGFYSAATYQLGQAYGAGEFGLPIDKAKAQTLREKAIALIEAASHKGDPDAPPFLALLYLDETGSVFDPARAATLLELGLARHSRMAIDIIRNSPKGLSVEHLKAFEQFLADRGHSPGAIDGYIDDDAKAALTLYEKEEPIIEEVGAQPEPPPEKQSFTVYAMGKLDVPQTYLFDLDGGTVGEAGADLWFEAETEDEIYLTPRNGALLGPGDFSKRDFFGCRNANYSAERIPFEMILGDAFICVKTSDGRIGTFHVDKLTGESPRTLSLNYALWE